MTQSRTKSHYSMEFILDICKPYSHCNKELAKKAINKLVKLQFDTSDTKSDLERQHAPLIRRILMDFTCSGYSDLATYLNRDTFLKTLNMNYPTSVSQFIESKTAPKTKVGLFQIWKRHETKMLRKFDEFFQAGITDYRKLR